MVFRNRLQSSVPVMRAGMFFLILAFAARWFLRPGERFSTSLVDALSGLLHGLAIGCLLLSLMLNRCGRPGSGPRDTA